MNVETATQKDMRRMGQTIWGQIEALTGPARLKLCLQEGLYTPCDPSPYTPERVAAMMAKANVPRMLSNLTGRTV